MNDQEDDEESGQMNAQAEADLRESEVERLRGLIRAVAKIIVAHSPDCRDDDGCCILCCPTRKHRDASGRPIPCENTHAPMCPWPALVAEAEKP